MKKLLLILGIVSISLVANAEGVTDMTNIWGEVEAYPTGSGKVYLTSTDPIPVSESGWGDVSEARFTVPSSGETSRYRVENGEFVLSQAPRFFGNVQVQPEEGYECVGLVSRIDEYGEYDDMDYYYGGDVVCEKTTNLSACVRNSSAPYSPIKFVNENGVEIDMNSGRVSPYVRQDILTEQEHNELNNMSPESDMWYYYIHSRTVERSPWPSEPTKIYALFKEKVRVTLDENGEAIFSSNDNLKLQDESALKAYVVYKIVNGKGVLKETDSIPARLGVLLKGEPGQTYTFDRIPEPKRLTITNSQGTKTYNALLCEIFGFYPESEIFYMYGNFEYGEGYYKVSDWYQPSSDYLTVAIAGGTPPTLFTLDTETNGIESVQAGSEATGSDVFDLQGRQLKEEPPHGIYIKDGKKIAR